MCAYGEMSSAEVAKWISDARRYFSNNVLCSKSAAREFLVKLGVNTRDGKLTKRYGGKGESDEGIV